MAAPDEQVVLLTGATGAIGAAVAQAILRAGGRVAATVRRQWQVDKLREQLGGEFDRGRVLIGVVPPRDGEAAAGFVKGAQDALGPITAFVGTAGCLRERQPGREPAGDLDELLDANLHANATVARAVLPAMRRRRTGSLVFTGMPVDEARFSATSRASKAALCAFVAGLMQDCADTPLRPSIVAVAADASATIGQLLRALAEPATST